MEKAQKTRRLKTTIATRPKVVQSKKRPFNRLARADFHGQAERTDDEKTNASKNLFV